MKTLIRFYFLPLCFAMVATVHAEPIVNEPMNETAFVKKFAGQTAEFVRNNLGEPEEVSSKSNNSGKVEFWLYKDIVKVGSQDKTFKYTQIGIINNFVETLGNTNRSPN
jgi:hypothetical protein